MESKMVLEGDQVGCSLLLWKWYKPISCLPDFCLGVLSCPRDYLALCKHTPILLLI